MTLTRFAYALRPNLTRFFVAGCRQVTKCRGVRTCQKALNQRDLRAK